MSSKAATEATFSTAATMGTASSGAGGYDKLTGGSGNDTLAGGSGGDNLGNGASKDTLTGNAGLDQFAFAEDTTATRSGADVVTDFNQDRRPPPPQGDGREHRVGRRSDIRARSVRGVHRRGGAVALVANRRQHRRRRRYRRRRHGRLLDRLNGLINLGDGDFVL